MMYTCYAYGFRVARGHCDKLTNLLIWLITRELFCKRWALHLKKKVFSNLYFKLFYCYILFKLFLSFLFRSRSCFFQQIVNLELFFWFLMKILN